MICFTSHKSYLPLSYSLVARKFGISRRTLATLPQMQSIPGWYSTKDRKRNKRLRLVDFDSVYQAGISFHGSAIAMEQYIENCKEKRQDKILESVMQMFLHGNDVRPRVIPSLEPRDGGMDNSLRFMAIVRLPAFIRSTRSLESGRYCIGCVNTYYTSGSRSWQRKFTRASFDAHLLECGPIRDGRHVIGKKQEIGNEH